MAYGVNAPFGLAPLDSIIGAVWTEKTNVYKIGASTDGTITYNQNICQGDPVMFSPSYNLVRDGLSFLAGSIVPYVAIEVGTINTNAPIGVFSYCEYTDTKGNLQRSNYWPASTQILANTQIKAYVVDDPSVIWEVQVSTSAADNGWFTTASAAFLLSSQIGLNGQLNVVSVDFNPKAGYPVAAKNPGPGGAKTGGISGFYLDGSKIAIGDITVASYNTLPFKILGFSQNLKNFSGPNGKVAYPVDPTTGLYTPGNNTGTSGGYFVNAIGKLNMHAANGYGTLGILAGNKPAA